MAEKSEQERLAKARECVCFNLRKTARAITQVYDRALKPSGLRATQFSILVVVSNCRSLTISRLAQQLVMDRTTLTRNLRPLQRRGLLKVTRGEDRRARFVSLTQEGERNLLRALPLWEEAQRHFEKGLGTMDFYLMRSALSKTVELSNKSAF